MSRNVELTAVELVLKLSGLTSLAALHGSIHIPFREIREVSTLPYHHPAGAVRFAGTAVPGTGIMEGSFVHGTSQFFLSFEHPDRTITLDGTFHIDNQAYEKIVFEVPNPEQLQKLLVQKCPHLQ
ncbi:hypothetical protein [Alicyclobacillus sp. SO9]|uniref:hypothetical protein n=1 Tax=Alicyclobacillus sp. SO9 TaxID=2665646 RepID=UPI0018E81CBD|nr:hypothetical protein [Alicyclobacillus sp. SO9]QQE78695.1 hypothetical protein GI364_23050 [Alicyclobacillus sp. SO9]